jgi:hypothetical protein
MGAEAAAVVAAMASAIKASGVIVRVRPDDFFRVLQKAEKPLIIYTKGGFLSAKHQYLTSYKGFAFFTKASDPLQLPSGIEMIVADKIWIP